MLEGQSDVHRFASAGYREPADARGHQDQLNRKQNPRPADRTQFQDLRIDEREHLVFSSVGCDRTSTGLVGAGKPQEGRFERCAGLG